MERRSILKALAGTSVLAACRPDTTPPEPGPRPVDGSPPPRVASPRVTSVVRRVLPIASPFPTLDPFLFCAHHNDHYPRGNAELGPAVDLSGRAIGSDFSGRDGFSMYHGEQIPGFPEHPHRGFETITVVRRGLVDHSDSLGAAARYGNGDVQWLTAGGGIVHAEMFPLLAQDQDNPLELFQIWLNLPKQDKFARPHFRMFWADQVPSFETLDREGRKTQVTLVAGAWGTRRPPAPPPHSWASRPESDLLIAVLRLDAGAEIELPGGASGSLRMIYHTTGDSLRLTGHDLPARTAAELQADRSLVLQAGTAPSEVLVLHGRPIGEPVVKRGPFVMNSSEEIREAYVDYQATGFGGWPWQNRAPIHGREADRFARHADGRVEKPA